MSCSAVFLGIMPLVLGAWAWLERRRLRQLLMKQVENDQLRIRLERLEVAMSIDEDIDSLSDDELVDRLRNSLYRRK